MLEEKQAHMIVTSAITALGATRQTRSHIMATIGIGNNVDVLKKLVEVIARLAAWAGRPFHPPDVDACALQLRKNLESD